MSDILPSETEQRTSPDTERRTSPDIERIAGPGLEAGLLIYEAFSARMLITPEMKGAFLEDTAKFMSRFFEQRGHRVNGFNVTIAADNRMKKIVMSSTGDVQLNPVVVHVVQGGVSTTLGGAHGVSEYICL